MVRAGCSYEEETVNKTVEQATLNRPKTWDNGESGVSRQTLLGGEEALSTA